MPFSRCTAFSAGCYIPHTLAGQGVGELVDGRHRVVGDPQSGEPTAHGVCVPLGQRRLGVVVGDDVLTEPDSDASALRRLDRGGGCHWSSWLSSKGSAWERGASAVPVRRVFTVTSDPTEDLNSRSRPVRDLSASGQTFSGPTRLEFFEQVFDYRSNGPRTETPPSSTT